MAVTPESTRLSCSREGAKSSNYKYKGHSLKGSISGKYLKLTYISFNSKPDPPSRTCLSGSDGTVVPDLGESDGAEVSHNADLLEGHVVHVLAQQV